MKRGFLIALFALLLGVGVFFVCYRLGTRPLRKLAAEPGGEMVWLTREFHLNPEQAERIGRLQADYEPRCMEMCRKIAESNARLDHLIATGHERTPEMEALLRASADIQVECRSEMLTHIYAVASVMSPEQAQRYLSRMKLQVLQPGAPHKFDSHGDHE
jgi:hypothetical protein